MKTITFEVDDEDAKAILAAVEYCRTAGICAFESEEGESDELGMILSETCRAFLDSEGARPVATCIGCGCNDNQACAEGCTWLAVDRENGHGVCSQCPESLADFEGEQRVRALHETIAEFV